MVLVVPIVSFKLFLKSLAASAVLVSVAFAASPAENAVRLDIAAMMTGQSRTGVESTDRGVFLQTRHCVEGKQPVQDAMRGQLKVDHEDALLALFQRVLCAQADDDMSLPLTQFGEDVAQTFQTGMALYSGMQELGEWPLDLIGDVPDQSPRDEAFINMLGLSVRSAIPAVSRWEVLSPTQVRVWFGQFRQAPSDTMTYDFELRDNRWVWISALSSTRF